MRSRALSPSPSRPVSAMQPERMASMSAGSASSGDRPVGSSGPVSSRTPSKRRAVCPWATVAVMPATSSGAVRAIDRVPASSVSKAAAYS